MDEAEKPIAATERIEVTMNSKESKVMPITAIVAMLVASVLIAALAYLAGDALDCWDSSMAIGANVALPVREHRAPGPQTGPRVVTPAGSNAQSENDLRQHVTRAVDELPDGMLPQRASTWPGGGR